MPPRAVGEMGPGSSRPQLLAQAAAARPGRQTEEVSSQTDVLQYDANFGIEVHQIALLCQKLQQFHSDLVLRRPRSSRGRLAPAKAPEGRRQGLALMVRDAARR